MLYFVGIFWIFEEKLKSKWNIYEGRKGTMSYLGNLQISLKTSEVFRNIDGNQGYPHLINSNERNEKKQNNIENF